MHLIGKLLLSLLSDHHELYLHLKKLDRSTDIQYFPNTNNNESHTRTNTHFHHLAQLQKKNWKSVELLWKILNICLSKTWILTKKQLYFLASLDWLDCTLPQSTDCTWHTCTLNIIFLRASSCLRALTLAWCSCAVVLSVWVWQSWALLRRCDNSSNSASTTRRLRATFSRSSHCRARSGQSVRDGSGKIMENRVKLNKFKNLRH